MPENLTFRVGKIELSEVESDDTNRPYQGFTDTIIHLRREGERTPIGVVTVRAYFTDQSMTIEQIATEARLRSLEICKQVSEIDITPREISGLEQRWR
jgi:hypothetical protein